MKFAKPPPANGSEGARKKPLGKPREFRFLVEMLHGKIRIPPKTWIQDDYEKLKKQVSESKELKGEFGSYLEDVEKAYQAGVLSWSIERASLTIEAYLKGTYERGWIDFEKEYMSMLAGRESVESFIARKKEQVMAMPISEEEKDLIEDNMLMSGRCSHAIKLIVAHNFYYYHKAMAAENRKENQEDLRGLIHSELRLMA